MSKASKKFEQAQERRASAGAVTTGGQGRGASAERESAAASSKKAKGISGVPGSKNDSRRCTATANRSGERCKAPAIKGGTVCRMHGGSLPQVKKKAAERLQELVDPFIEELRRIVFDPDTEAAVKVRGIVAVLDRTGHGPGSKLEVTAGPTRWEQALIEAAGGEVVDGQVVVDPFLTGGVDRDELANHPDPRALPSVGGGGDEDDSPEQHAYDERQRQWAELDAEDERPYATRLDPHGPNVVRGEVVNDPPAYDRR